MRERGLCQHVPVVDVDTFLGRARSLAGLRLATLTTGENERHKGSIGNAIERALGLTPSSAAGPDVPAHASHEAPFREGLEVKTLPVAGGRVLESTWVASASTESMQTETWLTSRVRAKLACVLFVPVEGGTVPFDQRRVGTSFVWCPDDVEEATLRADWEDLADLVAQGLGFAVSARRGRALQLRPKAANATVRRTSAAADGEEYRGRPQGFYLRRAFTQAILDARFPR